MSTPNYFYRDAQDREIGPLPLAALAQLRQAGVLSDTTLVRSESGSTWQPCSQVVAVGVSVAASAHATQTNSAAPPSAPSLTSASTGAANVKKHSWTLFAAAALCFLLPFVEVSCTGKPMLTATGLELATGQTISIPTNLLTGETQKKEIPPQPAATAALALAAAAALLALARRPVTSLLAAIAAGGSVWQLNALRDAIDSGMASEKALQAMLQIKIGTKEGYTAAMALLAIGGCAQIWLWSQERNAVPAAQVQRRMRKLSRGEKFTAVSVFSALVLFYGGPFALQSVFNRRPPEDAVRSSVLSALPASLRVGQWREIKSIQTAHSRSNSVGWADSVTAGGPWQNIEASVTLRQTTDLFRADDFASKAHAVKDDSASVEAANRKAARLVWTKNLPPLTAVPPLFARASSAGEEIVQKIQLLAERNGPLWLGWSPAACWHCWTQFFTHQRGWSLSTGFRPRSADEGSSQLRPRNQLPPGAIIVGESAATDAISNYHANRATYIDAVEKAFAAQKFAALESVVRTRIERDVAAKLHPAGGWALDSVKWTNGLPPAVSGLVDSPVSITVRRTASLYAVASPAEYDRALATSPEFASARQIADEFFPTLAATWPRRPQLYVVAKPPGEVVSLALTVTSSDQGDTRELGSIFWPENIPTSKTAASDGAISAKEISGDAVVLDENIKGHLTPANWRSQQESAISAIRTEEKKLETRFGPDRAVWRALFKAFDSVGGVERLRKTGAFAEQVRTKMEWPWALGRQEAEGSGSIRWKAQAFGVEEQLNVKFRFKPLLAAEYTVSFTTTIATDTMRRRSETTNCFTITPTERTPMQGSRDFANASVHKYYLNRLYSAHLLWHLAVDEGPFDVKIGESPSTLIVRPIGYPEFRAEFDPKTGTIRNVNYVDLLEVAKPMQVCWQLEGYRSFSGVSWPTKREVLVDGKREWSYEISDIQTQLAPAQKAAAVPRQAQMPTDHQIKSDLLGYSIGKGYNSWKFESLGEFREFSIRTRQVDQSTLTYQIRVSLMGSNNIGGSAILLVKYTLQNGTWILGGVDDRGSYQRKY